MVVTVRSDGDWVEMSVHDGGRSTVAIEFCPWCGARLPESQRDHWFATLAALGFDDPWEQEIHDLYAEAKKSAVNPEVVLDALIEALDQWAEPRA